MGSMGEKMKRKGIPGELILLLAAMIWGGAFVAQSLGSDNVEPFTFNAVRCVIGAVVLIPVFLINDRLTGAPAPRGKDLRRLVRGALVCGFFLGVAINSQQFGISYVETKGLTEAQIALQDKANVGKVGFLTALYIVLVPVIGLFMGKKAPLRVYISVLIALVGMDLLCVKEGFSINRGDFYVLFCAVMFSCQILAVDHFAPRVDCIRLSCLQFLTAGALSAVCMLIFEKPNASAVAAAWAPILYTGVLSSGVAYTLQIVGQKKCRSAVASLIMSTESVFSAVFGFLVMGQVLEARELIGCALMMGAVVLAQLPGREKTRTA